MRRLDNFEGPPECRTLPDLAAFLGLPEEMVEPRGRLMAKIRLEALEALQDRPRGRLILVTSLTPTPFGEGKTVTTIGLAMGLTRLGSRSLCTLREPSMGPLFGVKGGGVGGGRSFLVPREQINLHFTGDFHAVALAHNLLAAAADHALHTGSQADLLPDGVDWGRALDLNDRALRRLKVHPGGKETGPWRDTGFMITAASEVMAILALARGYADLRRRLGRIVVGRTSAGEPVCAEELGVAGAMAVLLRDALEPNLVQTCDGTPALVHAGPFANIAHGCSSVLADELGLRLVDHVVTEAGFGAEQGAEKFFHIKCRTAGLSPALAVLVASVRAVKYHSGRFPLRAGQPLPSGLLQEDLEALEAGEPNLARQIANASAFGLPVIVAINRFPSDTDAEVECLREMALAAGAENALESTPFERGGEGALELAQAVVEACNQEEAQGPSYLFPARAPLLEKLDIVARQLYGAARVELSPKAKAELAWLGSHGWGSLPVCIAKTQFSLSHDPTLTGAPSGYSLPIREFRLAAGAGFVTALAGNVLTMPGLSARPSFMGMDLSADGEILGL